MLLYPCSCSVDVKPETIGFCKVDGPLNSTASSDDWPVHQQVSECLVHVKLLLKSPCPYFSGNYFGECFSL